MFINYLHDAAESLAVGCVARDEGTAFVVYRHQAMSTEPGQGCAKCTAGGGLALTRIRRHGSFVAYGEGCNHMTMLGLSALWAILSIVHSNRRRAIFLWIKSKAMRFELMRRILCLKLLPTHFNGGWCLLR